MLKKLLIVASAFMAIGLMGMAYGSVTPASANDTKIDAQCTPANGWRQIDNVRVTACCVPVRADYVNQADFEADVKEYGGWGRVDTHDYIMWNGTGWEHSDHNMNMHGGMVGADSLVVDPNFIAHGSRVQIPGLPGDFDIVYTANDSGPDFVGQKWVNVSAGEGREACTRAAELGDHMMTIYVKDH